MVTIPIGTVEETLDVNVTSHDNISFLYLVCQIVFLDSIINC